MTTYFTSESVTKGHPDKVCDQIADAILDAVLEADPQSHVRYLILGSVDMRPTAIIRRFGLRSPIYSMVSSGGHFGLNALSMPWEKTDLAELWIKQGKTCCV